MRKLINTFATIAASTLLISSAAFAEQPRGIIYGGENYPEYQGFDGYNGGDKELTIPDKIYGNDVKYIGKAAFHGNPAIEKVVMPQTLDSIYDNAFQNCIELKEVVLNEGLTSIGYAAFENCWSLEKINLPSTLIEIDGMAFDNCKSLKSIYIPASVESMNNFSGCVALESITVDPGNSKYVSVDGVLYNADMTVLMQYPAQKKGKTFVVPATVKVIYNYAFDSNAYLEEISFAGTIDRGGMNAFTNMTALKSIDISFEDFSMNMFDGCTALENATISMRRSHNWVPSRDVSMFTGCTSLKTVTIPDDSIILTGSCVLDCPSLTDVIYKDADTNVICENGIYYSKDKTKIYLCIPSKMNSGSKIPGTVKEICPYAFANNELLAGLTIPDSVTIINDGAFMNCTNLKSITLSNKLRSLDPFVFAGCTSLEKLVLPDSVTDVYIHALEDCKSLKTLEMSNNLSSWKNPIAGCESLESIIIRDSENSEDYYTKDGVLFRKTYFDSILVAYPEGKKDASYTMPAEVDSIDKFAFTDSKYLKKVILTNGEPGNIYELSTLPSLEAFETVGDCKGYFAKDGVLFRKAYDVLDWLVAYPAGKPDEEYTIPDNVVTVCNEAFEYVEHLKTLHTNEAYDFYDYTFYGSEIETVDIQNVNNMRIYLAKSAFECCYSLKTVILPANLGIIWQQVFCECPALENVYFTGSKSVWESMDIYKYNAYLFKADITYNYTYPKPEDPKPEDPKPEDPKPEDPKPEEIVNPFTDVPDGTWYTKEVLYVYKRGAMTGKSEGIFDPKAYIQRSETIAMLYKLEGSPSVDTSKQLFPDVTSKNWYFTASIWGKTNGIISGLTSGPDAGKFMPKSQITRQDFTKILYEYAKFKGYDVSVDSSTSYTKVEDAALISKYARECMNWGYEKGFIANGSNFKPKDNITRREAAVMLARFLEKYDYQ